MFRRSSNALASLLLVTAQPGVASAAPDMDAPVRPLTIEAIYKADVMAVASGGPSVPKSVRYLDNFDLIATADLERLIGWSGTTFRIHVLNNLGGNPNDLAGTLQGIDNIEVANHKLRLFQIYLDHKFGRASLRAGLYDLNSEFYQNDAAGLLVGPAFGVGSEIAATGPNGPSIFPSTALALRGHVHIGKSGYARAAVINAAAGTIGDPQGVNMRFDRGVLLIAEAGIDGPFKLAVGGWGYTQQQDDARARDADGMPRKTVAHGAFVLAQFPLAGPDAAIPVRAFARAGISDGRTTSFRGGWQVGLLLDHPIAARPDGQFSIGANSGMLSQPFRRNLADNGTAASGSEMAVEMTYADTIVDHVTVQPNLQWVLNPGGERDRQNLVVVGMRTTFSF